MKGIENGISFLVHFHLQFNLLIQEGAPDQVPRRITFQSTHRVDPDHRTSPMKKLDRELGLFSVFAISTGAMLGPGLFVLPGLAYKIGGPASILAYAFAGLLVIPAALSMAEMSTALPDSGGPYLFLDRSLGPIAGTITGLGTWISLILKSAFSLIGLGAYFLAFSGLPVEYTTQVALGFGLFLIFLNVFGAKKAGQVQTVLVIVTMFVLIDFVGWGSIEVEKEFYHPFFKEGVFRFLAATAFVFVSYAGIAKVVSVAEEIKNPSRNIPWGISLSLVVCILIYTLVVYVIVGVVDPGELGNKTNEYQLMPLVQAGDQLGGYWGIEIMSGIAVLALASMANAGLMAASRFPLPLSRDNILPDFLGKISSSFSTPYISILVTGAILLCLLFVRVVKIAKLASAFLLMVFGLVNLAVIIFRESEIEWYQPDFDAPFYPFLQLAGFLICLTLIPLMGWFPLAGAIGLVAGCLFWYYVYARSRVDREGAFFRTGADDEEIQLFRKARSKDQTSRESVIVPFFGLKDKDMLHVERRIRIASSLCDQGERLDVVDFVEVPEQSFLSGFDPEPEEFEGLKQRVDMMRNEISNEIHLDQVVTHSSRGALRNYVEEEHPHWVVFDWQEPSAWSILIGTQKWWLDDFPCDTLFFRDREKPDFKDIIVLTEPGSFDGEVVYAANHIARYFDGEITFMNPMVRYSRRAVEFVDSYQTELQKMCERPSQALTVSPDEWEDAVLERAEDADLLLIGGLSDQSFDGFNSESRANEIIEKVECSVARIRSNLQSPRSVLKRIEFEGEIPSREITRRDELVSRIAVENKEDLFKVMAEELATEGVHATFIEEQLWKREEVDNTYIGKGVAFPHAIVDQLQSTQGKVFLLEESVEYADDGGEVDLVTALVGPTDERRYHLSIIGQFSQLLVDDNVKDLLLNSDDPEARLRRILRETSDE